MQEIMTKAAINEFIKIFTQKFTSVTGIIGEEYEQFMKFGLSKYLDKNRTKFVKTKTLLHRTTPVKFYDIYQPTTLVGESDFIDTQSINDVFTESPYITITGDAGSGKSTLVKHLFLSSIVEHFYIPIIIELRYLNDFKGTIEDFLLDKIFEGRIAASNRITKRFLERGTFVFFLDGYDEIKSTSRSSIIDKLNTFISAYNTNRFVLTSRPFTDIELLPGFVNYRIKELEDNEIDEFIKRQKIDKELTSKIMLSIKETEVGYIKSYLQNPLLLSLYILTFTSNSSIPEKKYLFYRRVFDVLFKEHDSISKFGFERELTSKLNQEEIEELLKTFSFISFFENKYDFDKQYLINKLNSIKENFSKLKFSNQHLIDDLKTSIALWTEDSGIYAFAHRSMQEYFAALYISTYSEDKEMMYSSISEKLRVDVGSNMNNLIGLCEEMDKLSFTKYLLIPTLKNISACINKESDIAITQSLITHFYTDIEVEIRHTIPALYCNPDSYFTSFSIEENMSDLRRNLFNLIRQPLFAKICGIDNSETQNDEQEISLNKRCFSFELIFNHENGIIISSYPELISTCVALSKYIDLKIVQSQNYITDKSIAEKSIISYIKKVN